MTTEDQAPTGTQPALADTPEPGQNQFPRMDSPSRPETATRPPSKTAAPSPRRGGNSGWKTIGEYSFRFFRWVTSTFLAALVVGLLLQHSEKTSRISEDAILTIHRSAFYAASVYDGQVNLASKDEAQLAVAIREGLFLLKGQLPENLRRCIAVIYEDAAASQPDNPAKFGLYIRRSVDKAQSLVRKWQTREHYFPFRFLIYNLEDVTCVPLY